MHGQQNIKKVASFEVSCCFHFEDRMTEMANYEKCEIKVKFSSVLQREAKSQSKGRRLATLPNSHSSNNRISKFIATIMRNSNSVNICYSIY
jgi:hypothetical protein